MVLLNSRSADWAVENGKTACYGRNGGAQTWSVHAIGGRFAGVKQTERGAVLYTSYAHG